MGSGRATHVERLSRREFWHFGRILSKTGQISREFAGFLAKAGIRNYGVNL
jgi:hypothetical protein